MVRRLLIFSLITLLNVISFAKEPPPAPNDMRWVQDYAKLLTPDQRYYLLEKLRDYYDSTSTEIVIVTENSLEGAEIFDYTMRLVEKWEIGQKGKDNGLLIYVAFENNDPRKRAIRIQVGYGLEGSITDVMSRRIISQKLGPKFQEGKYGEGFNDAIDMIAAIIGGEFVNDGQSEGGSIPWWLIILFFVLFFWFVAKFGKDSKNYGGSNHSGPIIGPMTRPGFGGGFGGGSSGGGFGGGFGGGRFGGGGAGGSW